MKWYEWQDDLGDGTSIARRYRTRDEAENARDKAELDELFQSDGDGSPVQEVDTDSGYFFETEEDREYEEST